MTSWSKNRDNCAGYDSQPFSNAQTATDTTTVPIEVNATRFACTHISSAPRSINEMLRYE